MNNGENVQEPKRMDSETSKYLLSDIQTKVAVLEEQWKQSKEDRANIKDQIKDGNDRQEDLIKKVDMVLEKFIKLDTRIGVAWWILGAIGAVLFTFGDAIYKWLAGLSN